MNEPRIARDIVHRRTRPLLAAAGIALTLLATAVSPAASQGLRGVPQVGGDQLIFPYDARSGRVTFLSVSNVSSETIFVDVAIYSADLSSTLSRSTLSMSPASNTVVDPTTFAGGGADGSAGLAILTPVLGTGRQNRIPVVPPQPLVGGFTFANLTLGSGFGQNPFSRSAVRPGSGTPAEPGTRVNGRDAR